MKHPKSFYETFGVLSFLFLSLQNTCMTDVIVQTKLLGTLFLILFYMLKKRDVQVYGMNLSCRLRFIMCKSNFINIYE